MVRNCGGFAMGFFLFQVIIFGEKKKKKFHHNEKMQNCLICRLVPGLRLYDVLDES